MEFKTILIITILLFFISLIIMFLLDKKYFDSVLILDSLASLIITLLLFCVLLFVNETFLITNKTIKIEEVTILDRINESSTTAITSNGITTNIHSNSYNFIDSKGLIVTNKKDYYNYKIGDKIKVETIKQLKLNGETRNTFRRTE